MESPYFLFKQKTANEMRSSECSTNVCYSARHLHDIDTEEVVQDDALEREVAGVRMRADLYQRRLEVLELLRCVAFGRPLKIGDKGLHPVKTRLVEWFENVEIGRASCRERVCQYV